MPNRVFYAVQAIGVAADGSTSYTPIHGLQSANINTSFNLEQVFEIGQISIYENIENLPQVEVALEKAIDGYPLIYHLCTRGATGSTLAERAVPKVALAFSLFSDANSSASGTPTSEVNMSGMFVSNVSYNMPVDGSCIESVSLVGNNKIWKTSSFTFSGSLFNNADEPLALTSGIGGVQRRENVVFGGASDTILPYGTNGIPGISTSGTNNKTAGVFGAHVTGLRSSVNLNRTDILELGRRNPFYKYVNFPVEVTTEIDVHTLQGDNISATEDGYAGSGNNLTNQRIVIKLEDGTKIDLGTRNKLQGVTYGGADTGGGNATVTYTYSNYNDFTVTHPQSP